MKARTKSKDEERCKFIEDLDLNYRRGRMFRLKNLLIKENKDVLGSRGSRMQLVKLFVRKRE